MSYYGFQPYVPVAVRRRNAQKEVEKFRKKGVDIQPVKIEGRKIARTFWGQAWCSQMESFGDIANRLERGRTYVRNGSVCHLVIRPGQVEAIVSGSELYHVDIEIKALPANRWTQVKTACSGQIGSLLELLQGQISERVMSVVSDPAHGLFPLRKEITFDCDCPDGAFMCKHIAAVLYGVGARLDQQPKLLFLLRGVNHLDLVSASAEQSVAQVTQRGGRRRLAAGDLSDVFDIELAGAEAAANPATPPAKTPRKKSSSKRDKKSAGTKSTANAAEASPRSQNKTKGSPVKRASAKSNRKKTASPAANKASAKRQAAPISKKSPRPKKKHV